VVAAAGLRGDVKPAGVALVVAPLAVTGWKEREGSSGERGRGVMAIGEEGGTHRLAAAHVSGEMGEGENGVWESSWWWKDCLKRTGVWFQSGIEGGGGGWLTGQDGGRHHVTHGAIKSLP